MKKRVKNKWLKALRSGEYIQGSGQLVEELKADNETGEILEYGFCCLGVLENLYHLENGTEFDPRRQTDGFHSNACAEWSGLLNETPAGEPLWTAENGGIKCGLNEGGEPFYEGPYEHLAQMNDDGKSFKQIALWIERNL